MKAAVEYITRKVPAISSEYTVVLRTNSRQGKPFFRLTYKDIEMPEDIASGFKRMYHSADIWENEGKGFSVILSLMWETFQGGKNGVTIFNEYIPNK